MDEPTHCCLPKRFKPVTHVIFDLDGTILDTEGIYIGAIREIGESYGAKATDELKNLIAGSIETDTAAIAVRELNLPITVEEFLEVYHIKTKELLGNAPLMPGVEKFIRHLHAQKIPIAVATSSPEGQYLHKTDIHRELFDLFDHVVCGTTDPEVVHGKPAPDIFLVCASRFEDKPHPSKCLVFEDSVNGMKGGLSAGMQTIILPDDTISYEMWKLATLRLDSFEYMLPELFQLPSYDAKIPTDENPDEEGSTQEEHTQEAPNQDDIAEPKELL